MMPGLNGLELARQIRQSFPAVRVVLSSAYHLSARQVERADCGAIGFVPKPYSLAELCSFLRAKTRAGSGGHASLA
jgi:DNA-binding response OmpR family regulator